MKKIILSLAVLAVAGLAGYSLTTVILGGDSLLAQGMKKIPTTQPKPKPINSDPDACAEATRRYNFQLENFNFNVMSEVRAGRAPNAETLKNLNKLVEEAKKEKDAACNK